MEFDTVGRQYSAHFQLGKCEFYLLIVKLAYDFSDSVNIPQIKQHLTQIYQPIELVKQVFASNRLSEQERTRRTRIQLTRRARIQLLNPFGSKIPLKYQRRDQTGPF